MVADTTLLVDSVDGVSHLEMTPSATLSADGVDP